jgi:hypothetical protein
MSRIALIAAALAATLAITSASAFAGTSVHLYGTSAKNCLFKKT